MTPLVAVSTSDARRRAEFARTDYHCEIGACRARSSYITEDGRVACGRCATPRNGTAGAVGWDG